jgi:hypothetical protein
MPRLALEVPASEWIHLEGETSMVEDPHQKALAVLIGKVAAADLKIERLRTLLVEKGLIEENELKMNPQEVEDFIVQEFANVMQGLGLASEVDQ